MQTITDGRPMYIKHAKYGYYFLVPIEHQDAFFYALSKAEKMEVVGAESLKDNIDKYWLDTTRDCCPMQDFEINEIIELMEHFKTLQNGKIS